MSERHTFLKGTGIEIDLDNMVPDTNEYSLILLELTRLSDDDFARMGFGC